MFAAFDDSDDEAGVPQKSARQPVSITATTTRGAATTADGEKKPSRYVTSCVGDCFGTIVCILEWYFCY